MDSSSLVALSLADRRKNSKCCDCLVCILALGACVVYIVFKLGSN